MCEVDTMIPISRTLRQGTPLVMAILLASCSGAEDAREPTVALPSSATVVEGVGDRSAAATGDATPTVAAQRPPASSDSAAVTMVSQPAVAANPLDAQRAYAYLQQICDLGPRPTGSAAMQAQRELLTKHFEALGAQVDFQRFEIRHPRTGEVTPVVNTIVQWHPDRAERILLCAHYDTRPQPDNPRVPARSRGTVFIGANDGGSGTALLMELGHHIPTLQNTALGVDFVFFDAEEFVFNLGTRVDRYFVGSEHFARLYANEPRSFRYRWGVLFDMVGDRQLTIYQEKNSWWWRDTRPLVEDIWETARELGVREFIARRKHNVRDDHLPLRNIGKIPCCNLIDFDYPSAPRNRYWHTDADTIDKCSGESLAKVGYVVLSWLEKLPPADSE
ncbi:MAG: peptidase M28 [Planctomycetota bacterium]|nr:MAG: peptidase M28 [Planctomycetota bacterium]REK44763.1 MAG: peptidase M28 [Planctomycetota bacterium]